MKVEFRIFLFLIKLVTMKVSESPSVITAFANPLRIPSGTAAADLYPGVLYQKYSHRKNNPNISFLTFFRAPLISFRTSVGSIFFENQRT